MDREYAGLFLVLDVNIARLVHNLHAAQVQVLAGNVARRLEAALVDSDVGEALLRRQRQVSCHLYLIPVCSVISHSNGATVPQVRL